MAIQRDSVSKFPLFPVGHCKLTVESKPEKFRTPSGNATYRKWRFATTVNGEKKTCEMLLFPWDAEELLLAIGGAKEGEEVIWDDDKVAGAIFNADIAHEADYKGVIRTVLKNVEEATPFDD